MIQPRAGANEKPNATPHLGPVKIMAGGITGWLDEGFALQQA